MLARGESPNIVARVLRVGRSTLYRASLIKTRWGVDDRSRFQRMVGYARFMSEAVTAPQLDTLRSAGYRCGR
jgi:hypothetical protein